MSNIYIQEPPTSGKVLLKTTVGDLEIELWTREAPLACRNFIQLCMENYYKNTIFHRLVKEFIVQGGDPTGTGEGGESIYGHPFKDEFHTRLRFCRRGLVAMANAGKDDNGSQFFFTLGPTQELQNKHTIFGKVAGDTIYNMIKLGEGLVDEDERPVYPQKILSTEVLHNPFNDIVPRKLEKDSEKEAKKKEKTAAVKNFKLLSFGEEAEEDEEETIEVNKKFAGKGKSAHDTLADPKLSAQTAVEVTKAEESHEEDEDSDEVTEVDKKGMTDRIKNKLLSKKEKVIEVEEEEEDYLGKADKEAKKKKLEEIKQDIRNLKKEVKNEAKEKELKELKKAEQEKEENKLTEDKKEYLESQSKYKLAQASIPKKGKSKDELVSKMLAKFKNTLHDIKDKIMDEEEEQKEPTDDIDDDSWMRHTFQTEDELPVLAKDASTKGDDWFEIYDPRNPMNKRRRGEKTDKAKRLKK